MATATVVKSSHGTLTGAATDTVNLTQPWDRIEVANRDAAVTLYFTVDGSAPTVGGANTEVVLPLTSSIVRGGIRALTGNIHVITLIGSSNAYSVTGVAGA